MDRAEIKRRLQNSEPTPGVPDDVVWDVLAECIEDDTGRPARLVDLTESKGDHMDHHARMRALLEGTTSDQPRSDLKDSERFVDPRTDRISFEQALRDVADRVRKDHAATDKRTLQEVALSEAADHVRGAQDEDMVARRAADRDQQRGGTRFINRPAARLTVQEEMREAEGMPQGIHAVVASLLPQDATRRS